jgi:putative sterol carrier protein
VSGRLRLDVGGNTIGTLEIREGEVTFHRGDSHKADAVALCDSMETLQAITDGALNPVVAALQDRFEITGDRWFAIRTVLGLLGSSPLRDQTRRR